MPTLARLIATAGYCGNVPVAPGTVGSAVGLVLLVLVRSAGSAGLEALALAVLVPVGVWAASAVERESRRTDPPAVVIDEVAGMMVTLLWLPVGWVGGLAGFLAFRFFDIVKPFPAAAAERLPGGWGVMADDLVAGAYAALTVRVLAWMAPAAMLS
ncbi:MAG: phosphatidylglycerophosphatase A [Acidobacteria bacterium]|nr:phosphatidylglycerophosphatase A [Acidobacteriota bacterium]